MNAAAAEQSNVDQDTWAIAMEWVRSHRRLVHWITVPYLPFMAADEDDLFQEAVLTAVQALNVVREKKESHQKMTSYFRVIFKIRCLEMATGIQAVRLAHEPLPCITQEEEKTCPERHLAEIEQALQRLRGRNREICAWILHQSWPVSTLETARHFNLSQRQVCRHLRRTLHQLTKAA